MNGDPITLTEDGAQPARANPARAGLVGTAVGTVASQQLSLLNTQLVLA